MYRKTVALLAASALLVGVTSVVLSGDAGGVDATTTEFSAGITPGSTPTSIAAGPRERVLLAAGLSKAERGV